MSILYIWLLIICIKFTLNFWHYLQAKKYLKIYLEHLKNPSNKLAQSKHQIINLIENAGIDDAFVPHTQFLESGYVKHQNASVFKNIAVNREDIVNIILQKFNQTIGTYRYKSLEAINPLFWIELIIFLPKNTLKYFEIKASDKQVKLFQVIYWTISFFLSCILFVFEDEIRNYIKEFIKIA